MMKYTAKHSYLLWLGLLLTLGALTIQARFGAPLNWSRQPATPAPATQPARAAKPAKPALVAAPVQSGGSYNITPSVIAGGGERSTGGSQEITGTLGQALVSQSSGGTYSIAGGFWPGAAPSTCPTITIAPASLPNGDPGVLYPNQVFTASGGSGPYSFSQTGTLPPGLSFNAGTATLSGTPTTPGTFNFTLTATDANQCAGSQNYALTINCPTLTLGPATVPAGTVGVPYPATQLTATGGSAPYTFQVLNGSVPQGMTLSNGGLLAGTPTAPLHVSLEVRATDANGCTGTRIYDLNVACPTITLNPVTIPNGNVGVAYQTTQFTATGGNAPHAFQTVQGSLPPGLTLTPGGLLSGTPTQTFGVNLTIRATDANGCFVERTYNLQITCPTITVNPATLPNGMIGQPYSQQLTQSGATGNVTFNVSAGSLPPGLTLSADGLLSGNPTANGSFTFTVTASGAGPCSGSRVYTLVISNCPTVTLSPLSLPDGRTGTPYNQAITASGGTAPYSFAVTGGFLPGGLTLSPGGILSGMPNAAGGFNFTVTATDNNGCTGAFLYELSILTCPAITVNPATLPLGIAGVPYSQTLTQTGGSGAISWSISAGALPAGLSLNSTTGQLAGLSLLAGTFNFTLRATDATPCQGTRTYNLTIRPKAKADFDNDGQTDLSVFRPTAVDPVPNWLALGSMNGQALNFSWGGGYAPYFDVPVPGDYDGDGKADYAIWRGADTFWYLRRSSDGQPVLVFYGANFAPYFDIPTPGDFDGDGKTDIAVFRRSGTWFVRRSTDGGDTIVNHGQAGDVPLAADFDGDGKCDFGVFRPEAVAPAPNWIILQSSTNTVVSLQWGGGYAPYFDVPVPADYDGDGRADLAIWRGADSIWYIRPSATPGSPVLDLWGANYAPYFDIPTPGDYDGDGKADIAVFRRSGTWFVKRSSNGSFLIQDQGQQGDVPLPANGVR